MFIRRQYNELKSRLSESRNKIQVISGPRQVGKSTMVKQILKDSAIPNMLVTADNVPNNDTQWIGEVWDTARARMKFSNSNQFILVIDEIHKIENWSEAVKKEWDTDTFNDVNIKVVILGSSRLLLKDGLTESLAGRYEIIRMPHWSFAEMKEAFGFDINQYIYFGGYPGGACFIKEGKRWANYIKDSIVAPAISKDILTTKNIFKPVLIQQLFELGCTYSGEELSLNKMLGQLLDAGNVTTLANYLNTLNESRLLCGLQKYAKDNARKYNSVPKLMVYNTALLSALSHINFEKAFTNPSIWGRWVESAVGAYLLNESDEIGCKVYYWRERNQEVDFIIEYNNNLVALEVKSGRRTSNYGIKLFQQRFQPTQSIIIGSGGIPVEEFLTCNLENLF